MVRRSCCCSWRCCILCCREQDGPVIDFYEFCALVGVNEVFTHAKLDVSPLASCPPLSASCGHGPAYTLHVPSQLIPSNVLNRALHRGRGLALLFFAPPGISAVLRH